MPKKKAIARFSHVEEDPETPLQPEGPWTIATEVSELGPWGKQPKRRKGGGDSTPEEAVGPWSPRGSKKRKSVPEPVPEDHGPWAECRNAQRQVDVSFQPCSPEAVILSMRVGPDRKFNEYERKGMDPTQIAQRFNSAGAHCRCAKPCYSNLKLTSLTGICQGFWRLNNCERGFLLRNLYQDSAGFEMESWSPDVFDGPQQGQARATLWSLSGIRVCKENFVHLLGTSAKYIWKCIYGVPDLRKIRQQPAKKAEAVDFFFYELYQSAAEPLPTDPAARIRAGNSVDADITFDNGPWYQSGDGLNLGDASLEEEQVAWQNWEPDRPITEVLHQLTVASKEAVVGAPLRFLPHGRLHDLYWLFQAAWGTLVAHQRPGVLESWDLMQGPPSFMTFYRRWAAVWHKLLRFRKSSQHAQCQTCHELQQVMRGRQSNWQQKMQAARDLSTHYSHQYLDRCLYWSLRWASRMLQGVLCIIIDSPDKTRYAWPRLPWERLPKDLEAMVRPRLALTGVIAHGFCTTLHWANENLEHGAACFLEVLVRTICKVQQICQQRKVPFPQHLVIQSDNTVAQAKNSLTLLFLGVLVSRGYFSTAVLNFLMVGHTHEDIDQLFGLLVSIVVRLRQWDTPEELMAAVSRELTRHYEGRQEILYVEALQGQRDFAAWLQPLRTVIHNALQSRGGVEAPHSFTMKRVRDLTRMERAVGEPSEDLLAADPLDVCICVKTYMRDKTLQQSPVVLVSEVGAAALLPQPTLTRPLKPWSDAAIESYLLLAQKLRDDHGMPLAADAIDKLVRIREVRIPRASWPGAVNPARVQEETGNPFFPHLPASSFRLLVARPS